MNNEIKKLYKNVGLDNLWVERYNDGNGFEHEYWYSSYKVMIKSMMEKNGWTLKEAQNVAKKECHKELLPFSGNKLVALIEWLLKNRCSISSTISYNLAKNKYFLVYSPTKLFSTYAEAIACLINDIYKTLSLSERKQIKDILLDITIIEDNQ